MKLVLRPNKLRPGFPITLVFSLSVWQQSYIPAGYAWSTLNLDESVALAKDGRLRGG